MKQKLLYLVATILVAAGVSLLVCASCDGAAHRHHVRHTVRHRRHHRHHRKGGEGGGRVTDSARPTIMGALGASPSSPHPGDAFTTSNGTWTNNPTSYTYQWEDCNSSGNNCVAISGATSASYTVQTSDLGYSLVSTVGACNAVGCSAPSDSTPTGVVATATGAPTISTNPTVSGTPTQGQVLTATSGTWTGSPTSYAYQWQDCDSAGASCSNISGATSSTYTLVAGDVGHTVRVAVTATNGNGSSTAADSSVTAAVSGTGSTLGYTTIGANCPNGMTVNQKRVNSYVLGSGATLNSFSIYTGGVTGTTGTVTIEGVVYKDSSGSPGALVGVSQPISITASSTTQWYTASFSSPPSVTSGTYWIGYITGSSGAAAKGCFDAGATRDKNADALPGGPTNPFGTVTSTDTNKMSLYVSYTASGGGSGTPTAPTNLSASPGDTTVSLSWTASTESGGSIASYKVFRNGTQVGTSTTTSYTDTGLTDGTTYSYYVEAVDANSVVSGASNTATATPQAQSTNGHTVPAAPVGVATPSGGWTVAYGDAFGSCLSAAGTLCSSGYPRNDNSMGSKVSPHCDTNPNEIATCGPSQVDVSTSGLQLWCKAIATATDAYTCGSLWSSKGSKGFEFNPGGSHHLVIQYQWETPVNMGNEDPSVWADDPGWNYWEIDFPEMWGYWAKPTQSNTWCGQGWTYPGVPKNVGGAGFGTGDTDGNYTPWCSYPGTNYDPSAAFHTYTMDLNGANFTGYIDGVQVTNHNYGSFNQAAGQLILQNDLRANRNTCKTSCPRGPSYTTTAAGGNAFPANGTVATLKYIAVYEPTSAGGSGIINGGLVPGTGIG